MSPSGLGKQIKPFVFLDLFEADMRGYEGSMPMHPHSGIATVTVFTQGDMTFDDPIAGHGTIGYSGLEWARADRHVARQRAVRWIIADGAGLPAVDRLHLNWSAPNQEPSTAATS